MTLITLDIDPAPPYVENEADREGPMNRRWWHYIPLCLAVILILAPQPSTFTILMNYHLRVDENAKFTGYLLIAHTLTFLALSSLMVCAVRDPGVVNHVPFRHRGAAGEGERDRTLTEALMSADSEDITSPGKWCRRCWAPKSERSHHCSICNRCVLKMDHHCPWIGAKCVGHWTYPAFLHFLLMITLLATYLCILGSRVVWVAFQDMSAVSEITTLHALFVTLYGAVFSLAIGSFFGYHVYLVMTNQTTIETLSPFMLLRYLPSELPLPPNTRLNRPLSNPPLEHELSYAQRREVKYAHAWIRLYDLGWRENWRQVLGYKTPWGLATRLFYGGAGNGDGRTFPRNPRGDVLMAKLAARLVEVDRDN